MFSNEVRSIRASLGGFTGPLNEEDRKLVRLARENLEALAVQVDEWEGPKPGVSIGRIEIQGVPENIAASIAGAIRQGLDAVGALK